MGGLHRHWAQVLLLLGVLAALAPFVHVAAPKAGPERRTFVHVGTAVSSGAVAVGAAGTGRSRHAELRLLVSD